MQLTTWGENDDAGGRFMSWKVLASELEAQLTIAPVGLFAAIARYGLVLDIDADRLTAPSLADLRATLQRELEPI